MASRRFILVLAALMAMPVAAQSTLQLPERASAGPNAEVSQRRPEGPNARATERPLGPNAAVTAKRNDEVYYPSCAAAGAVRVTPVRRGEPGYGRHLDRDGDGLACE